MRRIFTKKIGEQKRESKPVKQANEAGDEKSSMSSVFFSYGDQGNIDDRLICAYYVPFKNKINVILQEKWGIIVGLKLGSLNSFSAFFKINWHKSGTFMKINKDQNRYKPLVLVAHQTGLEPVTY